jgi:hypothetical protein
MVLNNSPSFQEFNVPDQELLKQLESIPDEVLKHLAFSVPWQYSTMVNSYDEPTDLRYTSKETFADDRETLQKACWEKFHDNPHVNTSVRGQIGRLTGLGFEFSSEIEEIQTAIDEIYYDFRNRLYDMWPKFIGRNFIEGELFNCLTCHEDGFIEVDFVDPSDINGAEVDGVIYHPTKASMPLVYEIKMQTGNGQYRNVQIPSIYVAYDPKLINVASQSASFSWDMLKFAKSANSKFKALGGYYRFITHWDKSLMSKRNTSHLRTVLRWLNIYEQLKFYEVDHKKSAGAFVWVAQFEDWKSYRLFLAMTDAEKQKTGLGGKYTPGSRLFLPPGIKLEAVNPKLPNITESDTDILHMITSGLNEPEDVSTGQSKGTFASVKASRGPMSDRTSDEVAYHDRYARYDFWKPIFFLKSAISDFPKEFSVKEVVGFNKTKPIEKEVKKKPEDLIEIAYPTSDTADTETKARAWLGVKHGSTNDTLGISNKTIAQKMGVQNYYKERLRLETEKIRYPELQVAIDQEMLQEQKLNQKLPGQPNAPSKPGQQKPTLPLKRKPTQPQKSEDENNADSE